ncbi:MAG TPA: YceI family protein [Chthoniobacteraceae bacterium]|jgi:polyisoprenoid-binding protein YceI|nr:YceI family protein [Chthoniobacteraceae bacterium]
MKHLLGLLCTLSVGILPLHSQESVPPSTPPPTVPIPPEAPIAPTPPTLPVPPIPSAPSVPGALPAATTDPAAAPHPSPEAPAVPPVADGVEIYAIDAVHSNVGFKVKHLFSFVPGRFNNFEGTISGHPDKPEEGKVNVTIQVASIDTKDAKRDQHLRSAEFFDADQFPTITFAGKKVHRTGQDTAYVIGDLTMRGVTKEAILQTKFIGKGKGMTGRIHTGWEAKTALKRSDYGLTWNKAIEGTQLVSDDIEIDLQIEAVQPEKPAAPATPPAQPEKKLPEQAGVIPPAPPATQPDNKPTPPSAVPPATPPAPPAPPAPATPPAPAPSTPPAPETPAPADTAKPTDAL